MAQFTSASLVLAPRCGSKITSENSLDLFTNSGVGKSVTKQPILLASSACRTSLLLTIAPLDKLINFAPFLIYLIASFEIRF